MTSLLELSFKEPGYPVIRGFIVPYRIGSEIDDVKRIEESDVEIYKEVLCRMREFVAECLSCRAKSGPLGLVDKLNFIADSIVFFLRIPLIKEPIPSVAPTPMKIHLLYHLDHLDLLSEDPCRDPCEFSEQFYGRVEGIGAPSYIEGLKPFKIINEEELSEKLEKCWFYFPADTRPGPNITNLFAHLTLTSAISWALAVEENLDRLSIARLRLAAILHDLGKPLDYRHHVDASRSVAEWLLKDLLEERELNRTVEFVSRHHVMSNTREGMVLKKADEIASSIDRLGQFSGSILKDKLSELSSGIGLDLRDAYRSGPSAWEFWSRLEKVHPGSIEELTRIFIKKMRERLGKFTKALELTSNSEEYEEIRIGLIDLGGIQSFITKFTDLRCVEAASLIVDSMVIAQIPLIIRRLVLSLGYWYPVEAILYAAGGIVEYLMPSRLSKKVKDELKKFGEKYSGKYFALRAAETILLSSYPEIGRRLAEKIRREKIATEAGDFQLEVDSSLAGMGDERRRPCNKCYEKPGREVYNGMCSDCKRLYSLGTNIHFKTRYESKAAGVKPEESFEAEWNEISKYVVELVSGHSKQEIYEKLRGGRVEWRDLAAIKVDGNLMGAFMASAVSVADAYERSIRVDLALKRSFERALQEIREAVSRTADEKEAYKTIHSIFLGLLYMGGDDSLILCPAWTAPVISAVMGKEFSSNMGNCRGLSIGIAVGKCRASIWSLIDAASTLMKEAKGAARDDPSISVVCFDVADGGELTGISAKNRLEIMRSQRLTIQPIPIREFVDLLGNLLCGSEGASFKDLAAKCYLLSRFEDSSALKVPRETVESVKDEAKKLMYAARESLRRANDAVLKLPIGGDKSYLQRIVIRVAELYARRQVSRLRERLSKMEGSEAERKTLAAFDRLCKLIRMRDGEMPYFDIERILKISGGGAL